MMMMMNQMAVHITTISHAILIRHHRGTHQLLLHTLSSQVEHTHVTLLHTRKTIDFFVFYFVAPNIRLIEEHTPSWSERLLLSFNALRLGKLHLSFYLDPFSLAQSIVWFSCTPRPLGVCPVLSFKFHLRLSWSSPVCPTPLFKNTVDDSSRLPVWYGWDTEYIRYPI